MSLNSRYQESFERLNGSRLALVLSVGALRQDNARILMPLTQRDLEQGGVLRLRIGTHF